MTDREDEAIRSRAYQIWEDEGRPEGHHESHWSRALKELGIISPIEQPAGDTVPSEVLDASLSQPAASVKRRTDNNRS